MSMKKVWLAAAIVAVLVTEFFPEFATNMLAVAVFFSLASIAAGLDLSERIYKLEEELEQLKASIKPDTQ
mgnify:CR=1 FL=1